MADVIKTTAASFVRDIIRKLREIKGKHKSKFFLHVGRMAQIDSERISKIAAFPAATVTQLEGVPSLANGEVWDREMAVTIVGACEADAFTDAASEWMDGAVKLVSNAINGNRDKGIDCVFDTGEGSTVLDNGSPVIFRSLVFAYRVDERVQETEEEDA